MKLVEYLAGSLIIFSLITAIHGCGSIIEAPVLSPETEGSSARKERTVGEDSRQKHHHVVVRGDTLYSIAWRYSLDYRELASWNGISPPYTIYPGQTIRLKKASLQSRKNSETGNHRVRSNSKAVIVPGKSTETATHASPSTGKVIQWHWPTQGKLVKLNSPTLQKGVNISGRRGQPILAAAEGDVVYSGSGLLGYGKLIIIKHNDVYLSAYAHNEEIFVKEGMRVSSGQKIATMGKDSDQRPLLHFEIRMEGKPVDPLEHLPEHQS